MPRVKNWERVKNDGQGKMWQNTETEAEVVLKRGERQEGWTIWIDTVEGERLRIDVEKKTHLIREDKILLTLESEDERNRLDRLKVPADRNKSPSELAHSLAIDYMRKFSQGRSVGRFNSFARSVHE